MSKVYRLKKTGVTFTCGEAWIQRLYDRAQESCRCNRAVLDGLSVMIEGSIYRNVWLETQPMAGEMYARRDAEIGLNNQRIFLRHQAENGRLPGMISQADGQVKVDYGWLQGCFFPLPAYRMHMYLEDDRAYLEELYRALERFDAYLWRYRDSDGDGCLETWCVWDTGEDNCSRFFPDSPDSWPGETPPSGSGRLPYASMDFMGYSCQCRSVLAAIACRLENGMEGYWTKAAQAIRDKIREYLWQPEKEACYDRDCDHAVLDILTHNNLRVLYFGGMDPDMADAFIRRHLLNPAEFWTPVPLPSIAHNDPFYRNDTHNNWSGQPQGLTYQRAVDALLQYHHHAEITLLGKRWLRVCAQADTFAQQYDPLTGVPGTPADNYGPSALAALEYISYLYGIDIIDKRIIWSGTDDSVQCVTEQTFGDLRYRLVLKGEHMEAFINDRSCFSCSCGVRVLTGFQGEAPVFIGMEERPVTLQVQWNGCFGSTVIRPNEQMVFREERLITLDRYPFDYRENTAGIAN